MTKKQYNHELARVPEQADRMKKLENRGVCAFCRENLEQETTSPIEIETEHWVAKANDFPYERTTHHILLIPTKHVRSVSELSKQAQAEFLDVIAQIEKKYDFNSCGIAMRSGDIRYNGGTVEHMHAHIVVGDTNNPDHEPVKFKLSSRPKN